MQVSRGSPWGPERSFGTNSTTPAAGSLEHKKPYLSVTTLKAPDFIDTVRQTTWRLRCSERSAIDQRQWEVKAVGGVE